MVKIENGSYMLLHWQSKYYCLGKVNTTISAMT